jgi:hypothetical protein
MARKLLVLALGLILSTAVSCKKTEADDLADAQACLDKVPESDPAQADLCMAKINEYTSQQAMILKCAITLASGGLMENKILKAYNALKDDTQTNKNAAFMAALTLDVPDINTGYDKAVKADGYCQQTGISSYKYLSGVVLAGTFMSKIAGSIDITNPSAAQTAVTNLINQCVTAPTSTCTDNLPALGGAVTNLAGSYCVGSNADQNVCGQINSAVNAAGSDPTNVGKALLCYMNNKTFNPADGLCH